ncbi:MAG TPA: DivIVA domain-containing protein [Nitrospirota bacterium]|nr:DivIVA domain-containing protein [Nitrospirota bacterium]
MDITPLDIKQKQFRLRFRGFDIGEVDSFLEEINSQMEELVRENGALKEEVSRLQAQVAEFRESEKELRNTLMSAQRMSEDMKASAERQAQLKLKETEMQAEQMLASARRELAKVEEEISELNRIKERFVLKIKGMIEDHLKMLSYEEREEGRG